MTMRTLNHVIASLRRRAAGREEGFSITELAAALAILMIALLSLARTATVAFSDVANSRQRQTGNQLANQLMEEVRALPYESLEDGLSSTDLGGDSNIVDCSGVYRYLSCSGEQIVHSPGLSTTTPLVPHSGTFGPPDYPGTYTYRTYVMEATGAPSEGAYRVRVVVDWAGAGRSGVRTDVDAETLVFSPEGCIDTATHPFGAPCQPYFYSTGSVGGGSYTASGQFDRERNEDFESISATLLSETADIQMEQITRVEGTVTLPSISKVSGGTETISTVGTASAADTDPATPSGAYSSQSVGPQSAADIEVKDGPNRMDMTLAGTDQGTSISATAAGGTSSCNLQTDSRPCAFATGTQSGSTAHTFELQKTGTATLFSVGTSPTAVTTYGRRYQPVATQNGLVRETVTWTLPEIRIGGIPSTINPPNGWQGYWARLIGFTATATVEAGASTAAPTITISGGTIESFQGSGYNSTPVTTSGGTVPIGAVSRQTSGNRVEISGTVSFDPSFTEQTITTGTTRTEAKATIGSPLVVDMDYDVSGDEDIDFDVTFSAGSAVVSAVYQP